MLFNSFSFLLFFLPIALLGTLLIQIKGKKSYCIFWLILCSCLFYSAWNIKYLPLIGISLCFNYGLAKGIHFVPSLTQKKMALAGGILFNLVLLCYFKYRSDKIALPLALSFVTFQQIAFLVDIYRRSLHTPLDNIEIRLPEYLLFILFFPQLIAGPIVYFSNMMSQYQRKYAFTLTFSSLAMGLSLFSIGLFKKVILADNFAPYADLLFNSNHTSPSFIEAWAGVLCYSFQLYFDFSGYSDMAVGLAKIFNIRIPFNFDSPYKAKSLIAFWRQWHITLSEFLKNYLYIPLGGNRKGLTRQYANLFLTMCLGGLWHGSGLGFLYWGAWHGMGLVINHAWQRLVHLRSPLYAAVGMLTTFFFVSVGWIWFRAPNIESAISIMKGVFGLNQLYLPEHYFHFFEKLGLASLLSSFFQIGDTPLFQGYQECLLLLVGALIIWLMPNTKEIFQKSSISFYKPSLIRLRWQPRFVWSFILATMTLSCLLCFNEMKVFLYYQF